MRFVAACVVIAALSACGGGPSAVERADDRTVADLEASGVPLRINGLAVDREDIAKTLDQASRPYLAATALYSMREDELLRATLQIGRFADDTEIDGDFRSQLVNQIGSGTARSFRVGERSVWLTSGDRQTLAVWFEDRYVFVLASRDDYAFSRSLLRAALEVKA